MIEINVTSQKQYVPLHYQPIFKVAQVLQILNYTTGRSKSASLSYLHTIAWALRARENTELLIDYKLRRRNSLVPWCFEPAIDKAIIIALVNGYCTKSAGGKIKMDKKGSHLVKYIEDENLLAYQTQTLRRIGDLTDLITEKQSWEAK